MQASGHSDLAHGVVVNIPSCLHGTYRSAPPCLRSLTRVDHPVTLEKLLVARRGEILFRKK